MTKNPLPLADAEQLALRIRHTLLAEAGAFSRVELAGSIRRRRPYVGDLELVAEIDPERDFGATSRVKGALNAIGVTRAPPTERKTGFPALAPWGDRYLKGILRPAGEPVQLDLFIVRPPAEWGVVFLIRTGSAGFSQSMVTRLHRYELKSDDGHIVSVPEHTVRGRGLISGKSYGEVVPCRTEEDFFRLAHMPFIPPEEREMDNGRTQLAFAGEV